MQILEVMTKPKIKIKPKPLQPPKKKFNPYKIYDVSTPSGNSKQIPTLPNENKVIKYIEKNCSIMLDAYRKSGKVLLRGINGASKNVVMTYIRPNRNPVAMNYERHKFLTKVYDHLGMKVNRENSIFCTTSIHIAKDWGKMYVIFVKDGWTGLIFEKVKTDYAFYKMYSIAKEYGNDYDSNNSSNENLQALNQAGKQVKSMKPKEFNSSNELQSILNTGYKDILITGENYIGIEYGTFTSIFKSKIGIGDQS